MGNCIYCGKPVGFLRKKHKECEERRKNAWNDMVDRVKRLILENCSEESLMKLREDLLYIAKNSYIDSSEIDEILISGWEKAVEYFLNDGNLDLQEEVKLTFFASYFNFTQKDLDRKGFYTNFVKGSVLREIMEGKVPSRIKVEGVLPFNFQKNEQLVWIFKDVKYYEDKVVREYVGGSHGISIRIAKGLYYNMGSFRGKPVETVQRVYVDTGVLAVTTKYIYFHGSKKSFRISYNKIVTFIPYSDGVGIQRDSVKAKPQYFITNDGWFTYNLLVNLAKFS